MSGDEVGMGMRFVRSWIGGPMVGALWMVPERVRTIAVSDRGSVIGRYVLCNLGWTWHGGRS